MLIAMTIESIVSQVRPVIEAQREQIFTDLKELTAFHSVHATTELADDHRAAAEWVKQAFTAVGLEISTYAEESGSPIFIGTKTPKNGAPTILLYSHYDVVPAGNPSD